jgi:transketolase
VRRAFADSLLEVGRTDPRVCLVTGDLGFQVFDQFHSEHAGRFINVGVAEAQMVYTAAGLAHEGFRPVAYSIASFATARPFEQIRYCIAYPTLPVVLVGAGRGYLYSTSGVSHHAGDDLGLMSLLPGMTVVAPGDPREFRELFPQLIRLDAPSYCSVGRYGEPTLPVDEPAILGKARLIRAGTRVAIISTGEIVQEVVQAMNAVLQEGITPIAYQFHTVKPLDTALLDDLARSVSEIIVVEEHLPNGALWAGVCSHLINAAQRPKISRLGVPDQFMLGNVKQAELRKRCGIDASGIANVLRRAWA